MICETRICPGSFHPCPHCLSLFTTHTRLSLSKGRVVPYTWYYQKLAEHYVPLQSVFLLQSLSHTLHTHHSRTHAHTHTRAHTHTKTSTRKHKQTKKSAVFLPLSHARSLSRTCTIDLSHTLSNSISLRLSCYLFRSLAIWIGNAYARDLTDFTPPGLNVHMILLKD